MNTTRNLWPLGIIGAFVAIFIGLATVVVIAATHRDSLVNADYYEQELKFQDQIDSAARAEKSGAKLLFDAAAGLMTITVPATQLAQNFAGTLTLDRPSDATLDRQFPLAPQTDGTQTLNISKLTAGLWLARVKWNAGGESYFIEQKIKI